MAVGVRLVARAVELQVDHVEPGLLRLEGELGLEGEAQAVGRRLDELVADLLRVRAGLEEEGRERGLASRVLHDHLPAGLERDRVVEDLLDLVEGQLVDVADLVRVHEAGVAHHVAAVGEVHGEDRAAPVAHGRAAVAGHVLVGEGGLVSCLSRMVADFQKHTGITATFQSGDFPESLLAPEASAEIVQIVREALNNVQKHSRATRVAVALNRAGKFIEISAEDNGAGFPFSGSFNLDEQELLRIGPFSIQKRVRSLKGELIVESRPERGSGLKVRISA